MLRQAYTFPLLRPLSITPLRLPQLLPKPRPRPFLIDPVAFVVALVGAPILVALLGFWAVFIPVFALFFGGPVYLVLGTPVLLWYLPRSGVNPWAIGVLAFATCIAALGFASLIASLPGNREIFELLGMYLVFGPIMAPIWGLTFGWLYQISERNSYKHLNARNGDF